MTIHHAGAPDAPLPPGGAAYESPPTAFPSLAPPPAAGVIRDLTVVAVEDAGVHRVALGDLRGSRATVIAFYQSSCAPCRQEIPALRRRTGAWRQAGVALLAVDVNEDTATAHAFLGGLGVDLPVYVDPDAAAQTAFGLYGVPSTVVLAPDGTVARRLVGAGDAADADGALHDMGIRAQAS